jgi:hypothetical protein
MRMRLVVPAGEEMDGCGTRSCPQNPIFVHLPAAVNVKARRELGLEQST